MEQTKEILNFQLNVRITQSENEALKLISTATGQPQTALIRALIRPTLQTVITTLQSQNIELSSKNKI